jgi:hypothetical protein
MQRIDTPTAAQNLFGAGKNGFTDGDIPQSRPTTRLDAAWFNATQEEVCRAIEGAGIALDPTVYDQLWLAIQKHTSDVIASGINATTLDGLDSTAFAKAADLLAHIQDHANPHHVTLAQLGGAPLDSPAFVGTPTGPTPAPGDNSVQLATTAFVEAAIGSTTTPQVNSAMVVLSATGGGNWGVPAGVTTLKYRVWGAGGGGGGSGGTSTSGGSGGGGGGYVEGVVAVTPGETISYTLGQGGSGGVNANGIAGGATTVPTLGLTCDGGLGGNRGVGTGAIAGVAGGSASGGQLNIPGGWSADGFYYSGSGAVGVGGGAFGCALSNGGGAFPGGGGGGNANNASAPGATGANGLIIFEWVT